VIGEANARELAVMAATCAARRHWTGEDFEFVGFCTANRISFGLARSKSGDLWELTSWDGQFYYDTETPLLTSRLERAIALTVDRLTRTQAACYSLCGEYRG
jgi:hypothetical protein